MSKFKIMTIFGTRPEAIKLAPVVKGLENKPDIFESKVIVTSQHKEMLAQPLSIFGIKPDYDLNIMKHNQDLFDISIHALKGLGGILKKYNPDFILVQGDTTTTFIGSLAAYYLQIPVGHVEAGLRTADKYSPFPEEMNRRMTTSISDIHFAPTKKAKENLIKENVSENKISVTGNTAIDALLWVIKNKENRLTQVLPNSFIDKLKTKFILVTTHRRESFGDPMRNTMESLVQIADSYPEISIIFPVHLNPNVRRLALDYLDKKNNVLLLEPLDYQNFAHLMSKSHIILSDSGGIQEEAPSLGKPVLVLRENTERPEGIEAGTAKLVGTNKRLIFSEVTRLLSEDEHYLSMSKATNPYGDGKAAERIIDILASHAEKNLRR